MSNVSLKPRRKFPILSLLLLLVAYISFGWFLSDPRFPAFTFHGITIHIPLILAISWIWIICSAFISPLANFSRFVARWFKSDTVAFLSIFMMASVATIILFWLHIFLHILTILATEALARVDVQIAGFPNWQAFLILLIVSLVGLWIGWTAREYMPIVIQQFRLTLS